MNTFIRIIGMFLLMSSCVLIAVSSEYNLDVYIRVYKIPCVQKWEVKISDEKGDIIRARAEGDLTAVFPDGIVLIQTDLAHVASNSAVSHAIRDRIYFGNHNFEAVRITVVDLKEIHFFFDEAHSFEEARFDREISSHSKENYRLGTRVKSVDEDEIMLNICFESGRSSFGGGIGSGYIGTILDQTFAVPEYKILLIGFPSYDKGPRGTVFWLAISAIKNTQQKAE